MTKISYVITDELGIHARPAGLLVKQAGEFPCTIQIGGTPRRGEEAKMVDAKRIIGVMGLALQQGDELTMTFDGEKEREAAQTMKKFLEQHL